MSGVPKTRWARVLGHPIAHSLSPALHNAAFAAMGMDAVYDARDVLPEDLRDAVHALRDQACLGANVTAPHKQAVIPLLDELLPAAHVLGAVNTIVQREGRLLGTNTDAEGLARWLRHSGVRPAGSDVAVIGAGGAGRAAVVALAGLGAPRVLLFNRTLPRAEQVQRALQPRLEGTVVLPVPLERLADVADRQLAVLVNATSMGHVGAAPAVHETWLAPGCVAVELAYNPPRTDFMRAAEAAGARAENGLGMLINQAILAFEHWTGQTPPARVMLDAARARSAEARV